MFRGIDSIVQSGLGVEGKEILMLSSRRAALVFALRGVGVEEGDEVCLPRVGAEEVVDVVLELGAVPVLVGVEYCESFLADSGTGCYKEGCLDSRSCSMDAVCLDVAIRERIEVTGRKPKAIVMRSGVFGQIHMICEIAFRYNIPIIDDACGVETGAEFYGRKLGTFGWHGYGILDVADSPGGIALVCEGMEGKRRILELMPVAF